jgi:mRNA-degrading endonuclease RelE of RelBE toxin-antitoxin system
MQTVAETPIFTAQCEKLFTEQERQDLITFLAQNPTAGSVIKGTGGVRKLRFAIANKGKRGGTRIIYYYLDETLPLYALLAYPKSAKSDLTSDEKQLVTQLVSTLKHFRKNRL